MRNKMFTLFQPISPPIIYKLQIVKEPDNEDRTDNILANGTSHKQTVPDVTSGGFLLDMHSLNRIMKTQIHTRDILQSNWSVFSKNIKIKKKEKPNNYPIFL